jgi:hypothetical protein
MYGKNIREFHTDICHFPGEVVKGQAEADDDATLSDRTKMGIGK